MVLALGLVAAVADDTCLESEHLGEQVSEQVRQSIQDGQRAFAVKLVKDLFQAGNKGKGAERNVLMSPASAYQVRDPNNASLFGSFQINNSTFFFYNLPKKRIDFPCYTVF